MFQALFLALDRDCTVNVINQVPVLSGIHLTIKLYSILARNKCLGGKTIKWTRELGRNGQIRMLVWAIREGNIQGET